MNEILGYLHFFPENLNFYLFLFFSLFVNLYCLERKKFFYFFFYFLFSIFFGCFFRNLDELNQYYNICYYIFLVSYFHFLYVLFNFFHNVEKKFNKKFHFLILIFLLIFMDCLDFSTSYFYNVNFIGIFLFFLFSFFMLYYEKYILEYLQIVMPGEYLSYWSRRLFKLSFYVLNFFIFLFFSGRNFIYNNALCFIYEFCSFIQNLNYAIFFNFFIWCVSLPFVFYFLEKAAAKLVYFTNLSNVDRINTLGSFLKIIFKIVYVILFIILYLGTGSLLVILSSLTVFAFAFKDLVFGFINAFFVLIEDSVNIGEFVEIAGVSGCIEEISLRYIKLRDFEGSVFIIPFYKVETIKNRGKDFIFVFLRVNVAVNTNADRVIYLMQEAFNILKKAPEYEFLRSNFLDNIEIIGLTTITAIAMIFEARIKIRPSNTRFIKASYYKILKELFEKVGIEFGYEYVSLPKFDTYKK